MSKIINFSLFSKKSIFGFVIILAVFLVGVGSRVDLQNKTGIPAPEEGIKSVPADSPEIPARGKLEEFLFTEDAYNNEVVVLNFNGGVVRRIKVGREPHDIALSPDGNFVVTGNFGDGTVSVINARTFVLEKTIPTGSGAHGVVFSADGKFLFVANAKENTLSIIDVPSFEKQVKIKTGDFPEYVGVTPDGSKIFTTNLGKKGSVTILQNLGFGTKVIKEIILGIDPHGWALSPGGKRLVITNLGSNFTYLLDAGTFEEISRVDTGATSEFAAFKDDSELWVTNIGARYVSIINVDNNEIVDKIDVGEAPHGISFSEDKNLAFVPLFESGEVVIINAVLREVLAKVKVGEKLHNSVMVRIKTD